jgi:hypothetical protein
LDASLSNIARLNFRKRKEGREERRKEEEREDGSGLELL